MSKAAWRYQLLHKGRHMGFSEAYGKLKEALLTREGAANYSNPRKVLAEQAQEGNNEYHLQQLWQEQRFDTSELLTAEGQRLEILSPGWWNTEAGPDFRDARLVFNGKSYTGDVELHWNHQGWRNHGHHEDPRYNQVILHVSLDTKPTETPLRNAADRPIATLLLGRYLSRAEREELRHGDAPDLKQFTALGCGKCLPLHADDDAEALTAFLDLAGEWRMLHKARRMRERMEQVGPDQAIFEELCRACGYRKYKDAFMALARQLPYERCRQLAQRDPYLLEAALFQLASLLPPLADEHEDDVSSHQLRLHTLLRNELPGLKSLPLDWPRNGVRPNNYPERRLSGLSRLLARSATHGLSGSLHRCWMGHDKPREQRLAFEDLFPGAHGFWATHFTWSGPQVKRPSAPLGSGRVRTIIGNIFVPAALAQARLEQRQHREAMIHRFFKALPSEPANQITRLMQQRVIPEGVKLRLNFCRQQGLLQMFEDWCHPNPGCVDCSLHRYFEQGSPSLKR